MTVALVHELLTMRGGAERVLRVLAAMYPDAPIYTLLYDEKKLVDWFPRDRVRTSFVQAVAGCIPPGSHRYNHHLYLPLFSKAVERWDFSRFDLVISFSSAFVHGIITGESTKHLCYVNSPARYLWDRTHDVLDRRNPVVRFCSSRLFHKLRIWDCEAADRPDRLLASSREVQRRVELYWRRGSRVVHPPIDDDWFENVVTSVPTVAKPYFLIVSTLVPYKRIELAIEACNNANVSLVIVGEGPHRRRLEAIAGPRTEFLGYQPKERLRTLYENAEATIVPGEEDFGLVPLESNACGTPVIAYKGGGALETVIEGVTGVFFEKRTPESLDQVLRSFDRSSFESGACRKNAFTHSRAHFERQIREEVSFLMRTPLR